jgi:hypothetical protein
MEELFLSLVKKECLVHFIESDFGLIDLLSSERVSILVGELEVHFEAEGFSDGNESIGFVLFVFLFLKGSGLDHFRDELDIVIEVELADFRQAVELHLGLGFFKAFFGFRRRGSLLKGAGRAERMEEVIVREVHKK